MYVVEKSFIFKIKVDLLKKNINFNNKYTIKKKNFFLRNNNHKQWTTNKNLEYFL